MLSLNSVALVIVDVQGKLATLMDQHERLFANIETLVQAAKILNFPVLPVEQLPDKLGETVPQIRQHLALPIIAKSSFSAAKNTEFLSALKALDRRHVLLTGIESHICVYQTAKDLLEAGYEVSLVQDAVSSRSPENKRLAIENLRALGVRITGIEMLLFELMEYAEHPCFREIQKLIK